MKVQVEMLAYHNEPNKTRGVDVGTYDPADGLDALLNKVFYYGQNDFQPIINCCSVSVGDVINFEGQKYLILPIGFQRMTPEEYKEYRECSRRFRVLMAYRLMAKD